MTKMGRVMDTTLFVKNGPCMASLGLGGEGYLSFSIATPTGEGVTTPLTFTRERRCSLIDDLVHSRKAAARRRQVQESAKRAANRNTCNWPRRRHRDLDRQASRRCAGRSCWSCSR